MNLLLPEITFISNPHSYFVDGKEKIYPSKVLKDLNLCKSYSGVDPEVVANAGRRGTAIHKVLELHVKGEIDQYEIAEEVKPYYEAFKAFLEKEKFEPIKECAEIKMYSGLHDYCTTIDIVGILQGRIGIIDYKSSATFDRAVELQTAAQEIAYNEWHKEDPVVARYSLQLLKTGKYRLREHTNVSPYKWLYALKLWKWRYQ